MCWIAEAMLSTKAMTGVLWPQIAPHTSFEDRLGEITLYTASCTVLWLLRLGRKLR